MQFSQTKNNDHDLFWLSDHKVLEFRPLDLQKLEKAENKFSTRFSQNRSEIQSPKVFSAVEKPEKKPHKSMRFLKPI